MVSIPSVELGLTTSILTDLIQQMIAFLRFVLLVFAVIYATAEDKNLESKGGMTARQESSFKAEINKNRLAKILEDLKSLNHRDAKKLHRILMHGKVQRKLNKALRKETGKIGNKNIFLQLRVSDVNHSGESSQLNIHQLKRFLAHSKKPSLELERAFKRTEIALKEDSDISSGRKLDQKIADDDKAQKPKPHEVQN